MSNRVYEWDEGALVEAARGIADYWGSRLIGENRQEAEREYTGRNRSTQEHSQV